MLLDAFPGLAAMVERRLEEAAARGELSNLPGEGRPLDLDDDALVPPELRVAYRIVRNAGFLPLAERIQNITFQTGVKTVEAVNRLVVEQAEGFGQLGMAMLVAVSVVFLIMVITFGEARTPFAILFALILRPVAFKFRSKRESAAWRRNWDPWALDSFRGAELRRGTLPFSGASHTSREPGPNRIQRSWLSF